MAALDAASAWACISAEGWFRSSTAISGKLVTLTYVEPGVWTGDVAIFDGEGFLLGRGGLVAHVEYGAALRAVLDVPLGEHVSCHQPISTSHLADSSASSE